METKEYNKMIGMFMGGKMIVENYHGINIMKFPDGKTYDLFGLKYHSSWDWIMKVVEKIEKIDRRITVHIGLKSTLITMYDKKGDCLYSRSCIDENSKITATYKAVVEFIIWYNQQEK
jgi:hypothetical protein